MKRKMVAAVFILFAVVAFAGCHDDSDTSDSSDKGQWLGISICTGEWVVQGEKVCYNGFDQFMIAWSDPRKGTDNYNIYIQTMNPSGKLLWQNNGNPVCTAAGSQQSLEMAADGVYGGVNVVWADERNGTTNSDIYMEQIGLGGDQAWGPNGVAVCTADGNQLNPKIAPDGEGGAIVAWEDQRSGYSTIYAQAVDHLGRTLWMPNGVALATNIALNPQIIADGDGGAIVVWEDYHMGASLIYAQKIDSQGNIQWAKNGVAVCPAAILQESPRLSTDGAGGAFITWQDYRSGIPQVYFQWVYYTGGTQFAVEGLRVTQNTIGVQTDPTIVYTGERLSPAVICWSDDRSSSGFDIYAQKVDLSGNLLWGDEGVPVCTATGDQMSPNMVYGIGSSTASIIWEDYSSGTADYMVYTQKLDDNGKSTLEVNGSLISTAFSTNPGPDIAQGSPNPLIVWHEDRSDVIGIGLYAK